MAEKIQNARMKEIEGQTDAFISNAIRYLDSATDYREQLIDTVQPASTKKAGVNMPDKGLSLVWGKLLSLGLIALLVCMILLLAPRS